MTYEERVKMIYPNAFIGTSAWDIPMRVSIYNGTRDLPNILVRAPMSYLFLPLDARPDLWKMAWEEIQLHLLERLSE